MRSSGRERERRSYRLEGPQDYASAAADDPGVAAQLHVHDYLDVGHLRAFVEILQVVLSGPWPSCPEAWATWPEPCSLLPQWPAGKRQKARGEAPQ